MTKKEKVISGKKLVVSAVILVVSIIIIAFSLSYAYFSVGFGSGVDAQDNKTAIMNVTSSLTSAAAINEVKMELINNDEVSSKAKTVTFDVTNGGDSTVKAKYIVKLINYSLTKNLFSSYFKWRLVVNPEVPEKTKTFDGNFLGEDGVEPSSVVLTGDPSQDKISNLTKVLVSENDNLVLEIGQTDSIVFYIWLENAPNVDQNYLTNGQFTGHLSLEASPVK